MQFLLIARMFGFSKYAAEEKDNKYKSKRGSSKRGSESGTYIKRQHIKSDSGLCAMDHKTLKLLMEMDNTKDKGTQIVNDHICQVTNTFTQNGRYTQIICTTFTPYNEIKGKGGKDGPSVHAHTHTHTHHHNNANVIHGINNNDNQSRNNIKIPPSRIIADIDTPPLPLQRSKTKGSLKLSKSFMNLTKSKHTKTRRRSKIKSAKSQQTVIIHDTTDDSLVNIDTSKTADDHRDNPTTSEELYTPQTPQPSQSVPNMAPRHNHNHHHHGDSHSNEDTASTGDYKDRLRDEDNETIERERERDHDHDNIISATNANITHHAAFQAVNKELSNLIRSDSDRYHPNASTQEKLERELAILHYKKQTSAEHLILNNIVINNDGIVMDNDDDDEEDLYLYRTTSCSDTELNQYQEDKMNGLILKDIVSGSKGHRHERRPSNLFRKKSVGRWKMDDLEDQEKSIRKQMSQLQKTIGSHNKSMRSLSRRSSSKFRFAKKLSKGHKTDTTNTDYTLSPLSQIN